MIKSMLVRFKIGTKSANKLHILLHDGHSVGVQGNQIDVLEESNQIGFSHFLQCQDGFGLPTVTKTRKHFIHDLFDHSATRNVSSWKSCIKTKSHLKKGIFLINKLVVDWRILISFKAFFPGFALRVLVDVGLVTLLPGI